MVCHFYVCSRTRGRREGWLKSATALSRKKQAREQKKKRIVCHIPWAGCENRAEGGAIGNTWARCRFLFSSVSPFLFPSSLPFFPCSFYPLGVSNNWDFYVTSKAFGFLFTEEIHFIIPLFLFLFYFILLSFLEFIAMNHKSYPIIGRPKVILNYLKLFQ